jgi:hypothetical protein
MTIHSPIPTPATSRRAVRSLGALLLAATVLCTAKALGADPPAHPCAGIQPDAERLACYDQAFGKGATPADGASGLREFGDEARQEPQKKISRISATVASVERRREGHFVVTLDNGQVWVQSELNSRADVRVGDLVTVRRGALGSYLLDTRAGIATRVKRIR